MSRTMQTIPEKIVVNATPEQIAQSAQPEQDTAQRKMLTVNECAERLTRDGFGIKAYSLKRWISDGTLHCVHAGRKAGTL